MKLYEYEILNKFFSNEEIVDLYLKDNSKYSNLFKIGYRIECWELPNPPTIRNVGGLTEIRHTMLNDSIKLNFPLKYSHIGAIIIGINYCNYWESINYIKLNNKIVKSIKITDLYLSENIEIEFKYKNKNEAYIANSLLYYLVSPYKHDDYYLNIEISKWSDNRNV